MLLAPAEPCSTSELSLRTITRATLPAVLALRAQSSAVDGNDESLCEAHGRAVIQGVPRTVLPCASPSRAVLQDPLAPRRGPLGSSPDRESALGNAPALVPGPLARARDRKTCSCSLSYHPRRMAGASAFASRGAARAWGAACSMSRGIERWEEAGPSSFVPSMRMR